jgi:hypothetical protein
MSDTLFKKVDYSIAKLMDDIEMGTIGLPDIQRPFVWKNSKIRDLFDSIYRGYPVGYFLFWQNAFDGSQKQIGSEVKQKVPSLLIVDGQQRLTSLYAVVKGIPVVRDNYQQESIEIAFHPTDSKFEVADAAIRKNTEYIPNISILWAKNADLFDIVGMYIDKLKKHREVNGKSLESDEVKRIQGNIQKVSNLLSYPFTALELSSTIDEEQVAEVFVRINSKGKVLNQSDFILTLMSVFWDEGRTKLEDFCRVSRIPSKGKPSPFNYFLEPDPDQLLRVSIGYGFRRARLKYGYSLLRGKDLETEEYSEKRRDEQFEILKDAQATVLNLQHWHDFLKTLQMAGFRGKDMISSETAIIYSYTLYLIGKKTFGVDSFALSTLLARWFFMVLVTGRYSGSSESAMERDLADIRDFTVADQFVHWIEKTISTEFTDDFWNITLPNRMDTSSAISPYQFAYCAALNLLHAKALFSNKKISDLLDPAHKAKKSAVERHHLFPKKQLKKQGITQTRITNQIANYALVEWDDNIAISGEPPVDYYPKFAVRFTEQEMSRMCHWHALPVGWDKMEYGEFLEARRKLMAKVIREGFEHISGGAQGKSLVEDDNVTAAALVALGETTRCEFKSTLRLNLHTNEHDKKMEHSCLKSIAAFLNSHGGYLVIGVNDDGVALGLESDGFPNEDKMNLHLVNLLKNRLGAEHLVHVEPRFETFAEKRVLVVKCRPSNLPVYLKDGSSEQFFVRTGAATTELKPSEIQGYVKQRF